jgi:hypothetical protein
MSGYDWYAAEGRPEHLRPMNDAIGRLFDEPALREAEVYLFAGGIDWKAERAWLQIATPDAGRAREVIAARFPFPFDLRIVAPAEYLDGPCPWVSWTHGGGERTVFVWVDDADTESPEVLVDEHDDRVVITLREPRYQGARAGANVFKLPVTLARPVGDRAVVDGATGEPRPCRRPL